MRLDKLFSNENKVCKIYSCVTLSKFLRTCIYIIPWGYYTRIFKVNVEICHSTAIFKKNRFDCFIERHAENILERTAGYNFA